MKNQKSHKRQSDQRTTKQVRIDMGLHRLLKIRAAESGMTVRDVLEGCLADLLGLESERKIRKWGVE